MATNLSRPENAENLRTTSPLVLASASPRRAEIMRKLGFEFEVVPADIDEESLQHLKPIDLAVSLARQKAEAVNFNTRGSCVIAADTVVEFSGVSVGKPSNPDEAISMLRSLSGQTHSVHTGISVKVNDVISSDVESTTVNLRELPPEEIEAYVRSGAAMDKAGAYGIQDAGFSPVESYVGSYLNVVGLPAQLLARLLLEAGEIDSSVASSVGRKDAL